MTEEEATGVRRQEKDRRRKTGDGRPETEEEATGVRRQATGRRPETEDRRPETEDVELTKISKDNE